MAPRSYQQRCGLARALDLLGERWTLLVVRELALGPKRFSDLRRRLPALSPTLLSERLRRLQADGLAQEVRLAPPGRARAYALTQRGEGLRPALEALALWGFALVDPGAADDDAHAGWIALSMAAAADPRRLGGLDVLAELEVDGEPLWLEIADGRARVSEVPPARAPAVRARTDLGTFCALAAGQTDAESARTAGRLAVEGPADRLTALFAALPLPDPSAPASSRPPAGGLAPAPPA